MRLVRSTAALLAWLAISVPTGLFVVGVMAKVYLQRRAARRGGAAAWRAA